MAFDAHKAVAETNSSVVSPFLGEGVSRKVSNFLVRVGVAGSSWLKRLQVSRMKSILMSMSDEQLATIGITRVEIDRYAKSLVLDE